MGRKHLKAEVKALKGMIETIIEANRQLIGVVSVHKQEIAMLQTSNIALAAGMEMVTKHLLTTTPDEITGYQ